MAEGYQVLTDELTTHTGKVDGLADRMGTAVEAANTVTMNDSAYGVICQPFAMLLQPFEEMGVNALKTAAESLTEIATKVRDAAKTYQDREGDTVDAIKKAEAG
ncbi:type VII secretion target [Amycolatopsis sp. NPDC052450]|uniref:type VII secretion target n=1 Tax=Amycolatopsis sp. NPDC052450 TaxID=3363937 RepID=UPI0037C5E3DC